MDNALIIDLVLAAVLALFALLGARKGLIRSLMALVSVVVALIGATLLTAMFVEPVTDLVYPKVEERVLEQFERDIPSDALASEDGDLSAGGLLPDELSEVHKECVVDVPTDFSSDCIETTQEYWRIARSFCVI